MVHIPFEDPGFYFYFMFNSSEYEILNANKYKNIRNTAIFIQAQISLHV